MKRILTKLIFMFAIISVTMLITACNAHICNYNQIVVSDEYLFSPATCESPAIYYYSCKCGAIGDDMFGEGDCLEHEYGECPGNHRSCLPGIALCRPGCWVNH